MAELKSRLQEMEQQQAETAATQVVALPILEVEEEKEQHCLQASFGSPPGLGTYSAAKCRDGA